MAPFFFVLSLLIDKGVACASEEAINLHLTMYGSYLILFANYFYRTYIVQKKPLKKVE